MNGQGDVLEREARARRAILRRASLFTFGMLAFTLTVAVGGSALIALSSQRPAICHSARRGSC
jgi:hypothetical protein